MIISLIHATYFSEDSPEQIRKKWLDLALHPENIDYCLGYELADEQAELGSRGLKRIGQPGFSDRSSAVQNWNAAAQLAVGSLLFVIADDVLPPRGWDQILDSALGALDPERNSFAIKVADSPKPDDTLLRHPIVSRAWFERHGLFDKSFYGVYCDNDITLRTYTQAFILDLRSDFVLEHLHPSVTANLEPTISQEKQNSARNYELGRKALNERWPRRRRPTVIRLVPSKPRRVPCRNNGIARKLIVGLENLNRQRITRILRLFSRTIRSRPGTK